MNIFERWMDWTVKKGSECESIFVPAWADIYLSPYLIIVIALLLILSIYPVAMPMLLVSVFILYISVALWRSK